MKDICCKFAVYYRDIPSVLEKEVLTDGSASIHKDGVCTYEDHKVPRLTISLETQDDKEKDKKRIKKLNQVLEELERNNQIIGYSYK